MLFSEACDPTVQAVCLLVCPPQLGDTSDPMAAGTGEILEPPKVSWAQIIDATRNQVTTKLDFFEPHVINGKPMVVPPEEVRLEGSTFWKNCLVGHFVGKRQAFPAVASLAKSLWNKFGLQEVIAQANGFIFFMFAAEEGMTVVLERGP